jgi:hypothetical protein
MNDLLASRLVDPEQSLRFALAVSAFTGLWAAGHFAAAARALPKNLS